MITASKPYEVKPPRAPMAAARRAQAVGAQCGFFFCREGPSLPAGRLFQGRSVMAQGDPARVASRKEDFLREVVEHIDFKRHDVVGLVDAMGKTAFQARNLARAARIYEAMLRDEGCGVILCLAGSLISAGLKRVVYDLVSLNMVDA